MMDLAPGMTLAERYQLLRLLSASDQGEIWQAAYHDAAGKRRTCLLKLEREAFTLRFVQEAMSLARLTHSNLQRILELSHDAESWFVAVEEVDGVDLGTLLQRLRQIGQH